MTATTNPLASLIAAEVTLVAQANAASNRLAQIGTADTQAALARLQSEALAANARLLAFAQSLAGTITSLADFARGLAALDVTGIEAEKAATPEPTPAVETEPAATVASDEPVPVASEEEEAEPTVDLSEEHVPVGTSSEEPAFAPGPGPSPSRNGRATATATHRPRKRR